MSQTIESILGKVDEIITGVNEMQDLHEQLHNNVDRLELEQDLLDNWLTKFADEDDAQGLLEFVTAYLGYRDSMNVKDAVENVVEEQNLEEEEEEESKEEGTEEGKEK